MTAQNPPVWLQAGTFTAAHDRLVTGLLVDRVSDMSGSLVGIESGVVGPQDQVKVTASGSGMTVYVSGGVVVVPRKSATPPGTYLCHNQGSATITIDPAGSNRRRDLIVARVSDSTQGDSGDTWDFVVIKGTEASTPTDPAPDVGDVPIAVVEAIPSAQNNGVNTISEAQITDSRQFVAAPGGVHTSWGGRTPDSSPGRLWYNVSTRELKLFDGDAWNQVVTKDQLPDSTYTPQQPSQLYWDNELTYNDSTNDWKAIIKQADGTNLPNYLELFVYTSSGLGKVTVGATGRVGSLTGNPVAHLTAQIVQKGGSPEFYAPVIGRSVSFYNTLRATSQHSFLATGLPVDTELRVRLYFRRQFSTSVPVYFNRIRLIFEPIG